MRVLADRHHAGLFESLALLFSDRFAWELYTPIGHEWWELGYWRFGEVFGDDRLAQQYLTIHDGWIPADGYYTTTDSEYPERLIRGVTVEQFSAMEWDFIVASVQENQHGFAQLASEAGAKFVMQVGNTNQYIDWGPDPIVLNSSEMPMLGRGIVYHQELDSSGLYGYREPTDAGLVSSFVNCFPSIACYPLWEWYRAALPRHTFAMHGLDGTDGNLKPATAIVERMAASGWGWHDKIHGDGFGHVIHGWAAIGRPLIGHASHYAGKMAEGLWIDGVTAIDLDQRSPAENVDLIRDISADADRHRAMCRAIRSRFDELVHFDEEAEQIRALLTDE